jgi:hypothetical protein
MTPEMYNTVINIGSMIALITGAGVVVSLALGTPVKLALVPLRRRKR